MCAAASSIDARASAVVETKSESLRDASTMAVTTEEAIVTRKRSRTFAEQRCMDELTLCFSTWPRGLTDIVTDYWSCCAAVVRADRVRHAHIIDPDDPGYLYCMSGGWGSIRLEKHTIVVVRLMGSCDQPRYWNNDPAATLYSFVFGRLPNGRYHLYHGDSYHTHTPEENLVNIGFPMEKYSTACSIHTKNKCRVVTGWSIDSELHFDYNGNGGDRPAVLKAVTI